MRCLGRTKPVEINRKDADAELAKDIQEKKLRLEMAKEFDRLKDVADIENFLANTTHSARPKIGPAGLPSATRPIERTSFEQRAPARPTRR